MAIIKKTQIRPEDGNDYETILYPETSADMVKIEGTSETLQDHINDDNRHMTPAEQAKLASLQNYTHPTGAGWRHIPAGGVEGSFLTWESNGNAKWVVGLLERIGENVLSTSVSTVAFSGLSKYRVVKVFVRGRDSRSSNATGLLTTYFNNITGDSYIWTELVARQGSIQFSRIINGRPEGNFLGTDDYGYLELTLLNPSDNSTTPTYFITGSSIESDLYTKIIWGRLKYSAREVIDQIVFSGYFQAGSRIIVYGGR